MTFDHVARENRLMSSKAKVVFALVGLVGLVAWVLLLDFGMNAGRIHYGVNVQGVDVGGLTFEEATDVLEDEAAKLRFGPVLLSAEGIDCRFTPAGLGWEPRTRKTIIRARDVGFSGGPLTALGDRLRAWFSGVSVEWARTIDRDKVRALVDDCHEQAEALGVELDRARLRGLISRAITTWPRTEVFEIPVTTT